MYPYKYSKEIVELFLDAHPRGWAVIARDLYLREEIVILFFQKNQRLWYLFKELVKHVDSYALKWGEEEYPQLDLERLVAVNQCFKRFFMKYREFQPTFSDEVDFLLYGKRQECPEETNVK